MSDFNNDYYSTIDDVLGPGDKRFFSNGYKKINYFLSHCRDNDAENDSFYRGSINIQTVGEWSVKGEKSQVPHVSTIDMIIIALNFSERLISSLKYIDVGSLVIRDMRIKAGTRPTEGELLDFNVDCNLFESRDSPYKEKYILLKTKTIFLGCSIVTEFEGRSTYPLKNTFVPGNAVYLDGFKNVKSILNDICVNYSDSACSANITFLNGSNNILFKGIESTKSQYPSVIDAFVIGLQQGQLLLYRLDNIKREDTHTLWMRNTHIKISDENRMNYCLKQNSSAKISQCALLNSENGIRWRTAKLETEIPGISITCHVAHQL